MHVANKCTLPHFRFNGSMKNSRSTGGGVHRSMRYGCTTLRVVIPATRSVAQQRGEDPKIQCGQSTCAFSGLESGVSFQLAVNDSSQAGSLRHPVARPDSGGTPCGTGIQVNKMQSDCTHHYLNGSSSGLSLPVGEVPCKSLATFSTSCLFIRSDNCVSRSSLL